MFQRHLLAAASGATSAFAPAPPVAPAPGHLPRSTSAPLLSAKPPTGGRRGLGPPARAHSGLHRRSHRQDCLTSGCMGSEQLQQQQEDRGDQVVSICPSLEQPHCSVWPGPPCYNLATVREIREDSGGSAVRQQASSTLLLLVARCLWSGGATTTVAAFSSEWEPGSGGVVVPELSARLADLRRMRMESIRLESKTGAAGSGGSRATGPVQQRPEEWRGRSGDAAGSP